MHLYAVYQHFDEPTFNLIDANKRSRIAVPLDDFDVFYTGARLYF